MLKLFPPKKTPELNTADFTAYTGYGLQTYFVTSMTDLFETFEDNNVQIITPPQAAESGSRWGIIKDPEGNYIEFSGTG